MKKLVLLLFLILLLSVFVTGCIYWETPVTYNLMYEPSEIVSIRIYEVAKEYSYSDPIAPCGELLAEIASDDYSVFADELSQISFTNSHLIILFPVTYDPNFYYGRYIAKIEYRDGSCELISYVIQRQFDVNQKYPDTTRYTTEQDIWLAFLRKWATIPGN